MVKVFADYHTHTRYSHGKGSIEDNVQAALKRGLTQIAITDHGPANYNLKRFGVKSPEVLLDIKAEVHRLQKKYPEIEILTGVEANVISLDGTIDLPEQILKKLDKVLVGLHLMIIPQSFIDGKRLIYDNLVSYKLFKSKRKKIRYQNTLALINAINRYQVDIITHPGYRLDIDTVELARACQKVGTALEINVNHGYLSEKFVEIAAKEGVQFVISSDAHRPEDVGRLSLGVDLVQKIGLPIEQVQNLC